MLSCRTSALMGWCLPGQVAGVGFVSMWCSPLRVLYCCSCVIGTVLRYFRHNPWNISCIKSPPVQAVELGHRKQDGAREESLALLDAII